jgi:hypothetical protein
MKRGSGFFSDTYCRSYGYDGRAKWKQPDMYGTCIDIKDEKFICDRVNYNGEDPAKAAANGTCRRALTTKFGQYINKNNRFVNGLKRWGYEV